MQWRNTEKQNVQEHHEKASFRKVYLFCFWENVFFTSYVACYVICSWRKTFKQPLTDVLQNKCSNKFCNIYRKTPVLHSVFNKVAGLKAYLFIKKETPIQKIVGSNWTILVSNFSKYILFEITRPVYTEGLLTVLQLTVLVVNWYQEVLLLWTVPIYRLRYKLMT